MQIHHVRAPVVELQPAEEKIIEAIAFIIAEAERRGLTVTAHDIVNVLFFADKSHLNLYGRPVTFDNYRAMPHGPVPDLASELLEGRISALRDCRIELLPWHRVLAPGVSPPAYIFCGAKTEVDEDVLSPSDVEALRNALIDVKSLALDQVKRLTKGDPAYVEAWDFDEVRNAPMSYALLFESPDAEQAEVVRFLSEHREPCHR